MSGPREILVGGRYALLHQLGAGGMASVWLAADRRLNDKPVALKRLHGFRADTPGAAADVERARREAYAASRLSHPNLVAVTDFVAEGGEPFIVMEYVEGVTLDDLAARGPLPYDEAARLLAQVAGALGEAHAAGIVHRDIKPANIIVTPRGDAKLADFGIARSADDPRVTATGSFTGTMRYLAPEVLDGADPDPAADLWALGATLFEIVEGRPAFDAPTTISLMAAIAVGPLPVLTRAPALTPLITRLLDRDPARRPGAAEAADVLRSVAAPTRAHQVPPAGSPASPPFAPAPFVAGGPPAGYAVAPQDATRTVGPPPPGRAPVRPGARPKRRTRAWMVVAVPAVLALAVGVTVAVVDHHSGSQPLAGASQGRSSTNAGAEPSPLPSTNPTSSGSTGSTSGPVGFGGVSVANPRDLTRSPGVTSSSSSDPTSVRVDDLVTGTGAVAGATSTVSVRYAGVLYRTGTSFDTTWVGTNQPATFVLDQTIAGFRTGIAGSGGIAPMRVGGRRIIVVPSALAYGTRGSPPTIPPNAPLVFVVDLVAVTG